MKYPRPPLLIGPDIEKALTWQGAVKAILDGHAGPRAAMADTLIPTDAGDLLTRAASVPDAGAGVKAATITPANTSRTPPLPAVQGAFLLFAPQSGALKAIIDGAVLTRWKTVADSLAGASMLALPDPKTLVVVGAGFIADALIEGYTRYFPSIETVLVWARAPDKAEALAALHESARPVADLEAALARADIVASATGARTPVIAGDAIKPGAHIDLIGAHGPHMREADDALIAKARIFVDCIDTTVDHIGELLIPIRSGVIAREDVEGDLYDLCANERRRRHDADITVYKNGGGAHLDVMTALYMAEQYAVRLHEKGGAVL
ncbi:MAG: ornithine cyclodeaminase family protein [Hyphococcus sp.]